MLTLRFKFHRPLAKQKAYPTDRLLVWLDEESVNGTFYSSHHDPNFKIEEVKELLKEDQEADNAQ